jgi:hypothetical protein
MRRIRSKRRGVRRPVDPGRVVGRQQHWTSCERSWASPSRPHNLPKLQTCRRGVKLMVVDSATTGSRRRFNVKQERIASQESKAG